ncbi:MAG: hypothetical protein O3B42_02885 [Actinomycetota bacterium]|nr:hypothetical protein [Actinomycetota bacterium]
MLNRKALYTAGGAFVVALIIGLLIGRLTAPSAAEGSASATTLPPVTTLASASRGVTPEDAPSIGTGSDGVPTYGTEGDRTALVEAAGKRRNHRIPLRPTNAVEGSRSRLF